MEFNELYKKVRPIILKAYQHYYIKLWEKDDWEQEGRLLLYQLLLKEPSLTTDQSRLYCYFKVQFQNHIKDEIRRQESQKRRFDRMAHEEISELSHMIGTGGLCLDESYLLHERLSAYRSALPAELQSSYDKLISGQRFKGRRALIRSLQIHLSDFKG